MDLKNRTILITGASSGIGAQFAKKLASYDAKIILAARRVEMLGQLESEINNNGGQAIKVEMDVTNLNSVSKGFDIAIEKFGTINTIIANAGINVEGPALELDSEGFDSIFAVNVKGVFHTITEGARRLLKTNPKIDDARMIIISSITASTISPGIAAYSASKAAVLQLGKVLAKEWIRKGINLNIVCPGYIETDINSDWFKTDGGKKQIDSWPRKRLMDKDSLDGIVSYLCSDQSKFVTGRVFDIDDGQCLN